MFIDIDEFHQHAVGFDAHGNAVRPGVFDGSLFAFFKCLKIFGRKTI